MIVVLVFVSVLVVPAGVGFTMVVLFSVPGEAAGVTTVSRRSHAVKSAALARMQMYFFIFG